ncbi:MAG: rRNA maturation RNAse YbeY [Mucinivorans sp.]
MAINFIDIDHHAVIGARRAVKKWIEQAIIEEGYTLGEITIAFCSDSYIVSENTKFLGHTYATDIITFDNSSHREASADLLVSVETVAQRPTFRGQPRTRNVESDRSRRAPYYRLRRHERRKAGEDERARRLLSF